MAHPEFNQAVHAARGVMFDLDGQSRPAAKKDQGADEFLPTPVVARLLTPGDVGPGAR